MTNLDTGTMKNLRHLIANTIALEKAYNVPGVCKRYGLADGDGTEAFAGKYKYVQARVHELPSAKVLSIARALYQDEPNFELGEALALIDEKGSPPVTEVTRRRLAASLDAIKLSGEIGLEEIFGKLWPIEIMYRDGVTLQDIILKHCFVYDDDRHNRLLLEMLGFYTCSRQQAFRVLEAITSPVVQLDPASQTQLVGVINRDLRPDGYALTQAGKISGSPRFVVRRLADDGTTPADDEISAALATLSETDIHERWTKALERRKTDPGGAITLARTLLEDVCKGILAEAGETPSDKDDLPVLYRRLAKLLNLAPDAHTEQVFKQILGSCQAIVEGLGAIRNKLGDAHSSGPRKARAQPRHAEFSVNLAGTMSTFLVQTWRARSEDKQKAAS